MARHGRQTYNPRSSTRRSRQVQDQTIGTHVTRSGQATTRRSSRRVPHGSAFAEGIARRARIRRIIVIVVVLAVVAGIAIFAGSMAFRGVLGSKMSLQNSDALEALVEPKKDEPVFTLVNVELGAVATPLDNGGPDVLILARLDQAAGSVALVNVPVTLQITENNRSESLIEVAAGGDAALINALASFTKVNIAHYVKMGEGDLAGLVDALGGISVDVDQVIDDPKAGPVYLEPGTQTLDGQAALAYLRSTNFATGEEARLEHRLLFASKLVEKFFSTEGNFSARLESLSPFFQTDMGLDEFESLASWVGGMRGDDMTLTSMPGYTTEMTDVSGGRGGRFIGSASDWQELLTDLQEGREVKTVGAVDTSSVDPAGFTIEVQNGTTIEGAAGVTADALKAQGFNVPEVGNAEQPVYDETLVVYKSDQGAAQAQAVVKALGSGRVVEASMFYSFETDVLVIVGADFKPAS